MKLWKEELVSLAGQQAVKTLPWGTMKFQTAPSGTWNKRCPLMDVNLPLIVLTTKRSFRGYQVQFPAVFDDLLEDEVASPVLAADPASPVHRSCAVKKD